jgi:hypothetical protein
MKVYTVYKKRYNSRLEYTFVLIEPGKRWSKVMYIDGSPYIRNISYGDILTIISDTDDITAMDNSSGEYDIAIQFAKMLTL